MLAALIIVFREVFEAGLIVGIVLAVTRAVAGRGWWISGGVAAGVLGACIVAAFAGALSSAFAGVGQEMFNAAVLGLAVVMLTWHNVWMARHGRELAAEKDAHAPQEDLLDVILRRRILRRVGPTLKQDTEPEADVVVDLDDGLALSDRRDE